MKVAVIGSRSIARIDLGQYLPEKVDAIVTGGAAGVDTIAMQYAKANGLKLIVFYPDYKTHGRGAPLKRNRLIVEEADLVLAFWDGKSRGTRNTIEQAERAGKKCTTIVSG